MSNFNSADIAAFKDVWVFCEQREGKLMPTDFELISKGRDLANELGVNLCGLLLGAFFMATDYVTSPTTNKGKIIFGLGLGIIHLPGQQDEHMPVSPQGQHAPHGDVPRMPLHLVNIIGPGPDIRRIQHLAVLLHDVGTAARTVEACHQAHHDAGIRGKHGHGPLVLGLDGPALGDVHRKEAVRPQGGGHGGRGPQKKTAQQDSAVFHARSGTCFYRRRSDRCPL